MGGPQGGTGLLEGNFAGPGQRPDNPYSKPKDEGPVEFKNLFATGMDKISDRVKTSQSSIDQHLEDMQNRRSNPGQPDAPAAGASPFDNPAPTNPVATPELDPFSAMEQPAPVNPAAVAQAPVASPMDSFDPFGDSGPTQPVAAPAQPAA